MLLSCRQLLLQLQLQFAAELFAQCGGLVGNPFLHLARTAAAGIYRSCNASSGMLRVIPCIAQSSRHYYNSFHNNSAKLGWLTIDQVQSSAVS